MPIDVCWVGSPTCYPDWNGVAALATAAATAVALAIPVSLIWKERTEWRATVREVCSAVDRIVAYHQIATQLIANDPLYWPELDACERIAEHVIDLQRALQVLITRPSLTDGAITAAASSERIGASIIAALAGPQGHPNGEWARRRDRLARTALAANIALQRTTAVRNYTGLNPSTGAAAITAKYGALIKQCEAARLNNAAPACEALDATPH